MKKYLSFLIIMVLTAVSIHAQTANDHFLQAMEFKKKGNYTETVKLMRKALALEPANQSFKQEMADALYLGKVYFESIPLYEELLKQDAQNIIILARLSEMCSMSPQKMKAVEYAEKAMKLKSKDGQINKMLARTFFEVKHFPKAIELYLLAEKALPNDLDVPFKLGMCYRKINNNRESMKCFVHALNQDPSNGSKAYEAANSCYDAGNFTLALELYQKAETNGHYKSKTFYDSWALTCLALNDYEKSLFYYAKAKEFAPFDKGLNLSIAEVYMKTGDFNKCREILDEMLQLNPNDAEVIYTKGMTYYKTGNTPKAESFFNKAFEIDPSLKSLRYTKLGM